MVAGAALGSAGLFSPGGVAGSGGTLWSGACCATAEGVISRPTKAVFTGIRRDISTPLAMRRCRPVRRMRVIIINSRAIETYLQVNSAGASVLDRLSVRADLAGRSLTA